jgi:hypothetical protein
VKEEYRLKIFWYRVFKRIFGSKWNKVTGAGGN